MATSSSPEPRAPSLDAPNSYDSDQGDNSILAVLQSEPTSCAKTSPLRTALGKAFELAVAKTESAEESDPDQVKVFLRLRPTASDEESCIEVRPDGCSVRATAPPPINQKKEFKDARDYSFTKVMDESSTQSDVYDQAAKDIVKSFCDEGKSGLIFTYGVTNAGKSFTVLGNQSNPGLLPRALETVCSNINETDILSVSYMEIYNEQIYDLLDTSDSAAVTRSNSFNSAFSSISSSLTDRPSRKNLMIRDRGGKVVVDGLSHHKITSASEAMALVDSGSKTRSTCSHNLNSDSSRSHSVCTIELIRKGALLNDHELNHQVPAMLYIVDLAGSERGERTGAGGVSKKQTEANSINTSLFTLMTCLGSLRENSKKSSSSSSSSSAMLTARYRESKLTRILAPHLSGNSSGPGGAGSTCMIVNANPRGSDFIETCYVLSQTAPCTKIKIKTSSSSSSSNSLLSAAQKFDMNGRKVMKGAAAIASGMTTGGGGGGGKNGHQKKRSMTYEVSHPMTRRQRLTSNDSVDSSMSLDNHSTRNSSSSSFLTKRSISLNYENDIMNLKNENELLKKEIEKMKEEAENNEMMIREECAEVIENISNKFYGDNNSSSSSSSLLMKSNSLSSVAEEDNGQDGPVIDILQSARKKKKQDDIQQMVDDLEEKCEDLEEELARSNKEVKTLTMALQASRQESDASLMEGETEEGTEDGGGGVKKLTRIPERWIMLDFLTQLLTAPNTMNVEEFNVEQAGLAKALENISFSSPLRNCAKQFEQNNDELNNNDKVNNIAQALREALKLNNTHNDDDLKEISELKEKLKVRDTEIASLKSSVEVPQQKKEQVVEVLPPQTTDITSSSSSSEVSTENELMACIENSELGKVEEKMDEDIPQESMNPLICADENIKESSSSTVSPPVPKIITQLAPLDPNSPVKAHQPQSEKAMDNSGKYSPSVLGNMSKRIREKAVKKTKKADDKKKVLKASPRRTRSSTLFLRV